MKEKNTGSAPPPSMASDRNQLKSKISDDAIKFKESAKEKADEAADQAKRQAEAGVSRAAGTVDELSEVVAATASALSDQDKQGMADYATKLADSMNTLSNHLRERSFEDLTRDARGIARDNPTAFLLGSVAIGFGLSRFLKATDQRQPSHDEYEAGEQSFPTSGSATSTPTYVNQTTPEVGAGTASPIDENRTTPVTERSPL